MINVKKLLLISSVIFSFTSQAYEQNNEMEITYDALGQIVLTSFHEANTLEDTSRKPSEYVSEMHYDVEEFSTEKDEAVWLLTKLASYQGKVNFIFHRSGSFGLESQEDKNQMNNEGYSVCFIVGKEKTPSTNFCMSATGYLTSKISIQERNEIILSALNQTDIKKNNKINAFTAHSYAASEIIASPTAGGVDDKKPKRPPTPPEVDEYREWLEEQLREVCRGDGCSRSGVSDGWNQDTKRHYVFGFYRHKDGTSDNRYHEAWF